MSAIVSRCGQVRRRDASRVDGGEAGDPDDVGPVDVGPEDVEDSDGI
jgi:hypothetical protein